MHFFSRKNKSHKTRYYFPSHKLVNFKTIISVKIYKPPHQNNSNFSMKTKNITLTKPCADGKNVQKKYVMKKKAADWSPLSAERRLSQQL